MMIPNTQCEYQLEQGLEQHLEQVFKNASSKIYERYPFRNLK